MTAHTENKIFKEEWLHPIWEDTYIYRETFMMIEEDGICKAPFLLSPESVLKVESYDEEIVYEEGRDYLICEDNLVLTEGTRIPHTRWETFYLPTERDAQEAVNKIGFELGFGLVELTDGRYLNLTTIGNPEFVTKWQVAVTYRAKAAFSGYIPQGAMKQLPRLSEKLKKKEAISYVLYGDSISCGFDCSGIYGLKPGQPIWADLLLHQMERTWQVPIVYHNSSVSGMDTEWAIEHANENVCKYQPDLVIIGYGMNDRCNGAEFKEKVDRLIKTIRKECPETEFVLIATTLPNKLSNTAPLYFCAYQEEHSDNLKALCKEGVVLADVQAVHKEIEKKKRYVDLTGNFLNHPNDYLARVQAQVLAAVLEVK